MYWAIREAFDQIGHPADLTLLSLGGGGGRGIAPGTLEELGRPGLCTRLITGHFETFFAMLDLAAAGQCELQCVPQGTMALLFRALARGQHSLLTGTGVGTFIDPRVGAGSYVAGPARESLVSVAGGRGGADGESGDASGGRRGAQRGHDDSDPGHRCPIM